MPRVIALTFNDPAVPSASILSLSIVQMSCSRYLVMMPGPVCPHSGLSIFYGPSLSPDCKRTFKTLDCHDLSTKHGLSFRSVATGSFTYFVLFFLGFTSVLFSVDGF